MKQQQYKSLTMSDCENFYKNLEISEYFPGSKPQCQSKSFARLTKIVNKPSNKIPRPKSQLSSLRDLLSETPSIKFTPREIRGCFGPHDTAWNPRKDATKDIRSGDKGWNLGAPTPSGGYVYMKDFQDPRDTSYWFQRKLETRTRRKPSNTVVDLVQITFRPGIVDHFQKEKERHEAPEASQEFIQSRQESDQSKEQTPIVVPREEVLAWSTMRTKLLGLNGCSEISYGICLEPADTVFLCICEYSNPFTPYNYILTMTLKLGKTPAPARKIYPSEGLSQKKCSLTLARIFSDHLRPLTTLSSSQA